MTKNEEQIKRLIKEIDDIENHIKLLKATIKDLKNQLRHAVETDED